MWYKWYNRLVCWHIHTVSWYIASYHPTQTVTLHETFEKVSQQTFPLWWVDWGTDSKNILRSQAVRRHHFHSSWKFHLQQSKYERLKLLGTKGKMRMGPGDDGAGLWHVSSVLCVWSTNEGCFMSQWLMSHKPTSAWW